VQIDVPETLSIEGRAAFYDTTGAYRDMVVTHPFQVMDEKEKVFEALRPIDVQHVVRGQYQGYRSEPGVAADSQTDTMVALRAEVDNWRWQGIPFFLRSGKATGASRQIVTLGFHQPPLCMFRARLPDTPAEPDQRDRHRFRRPRGLWEISTPPLDNPPPVQAYTRGSWGPESVSKLIAPYRWHLPER
jgi:glucose-6-phosphate 1-dehydrogenase